MDRVPIYLESDDEITSAVDKLKNAEGASLDIVIPKESIMLQSVINLKLLKRQAESLGKDITIVTTDKVGQKLAEQIGIPVVAKVGQEAKVVNMAEIDKPEFSEEDIEEKEVRDTGDIQDTRDEEKVVEPTKEVVDEVAAPKATKKKSWLGLHKKGAWIAAGFVALALAVVAYIYVPLAHITLRLAAESKTLDLTFVADKAVTEVSVEEQKIPAREVVAELDKEETFQATGKKDVGEKATGTVTVSDSGYTSQPASTTLVAGTRFVSSSGFVFRSKTNVSVPGFKTVGGVTTPGTATVTVEAEAVGDKYNIGATTFTIPALNTTKMTASSSAAFTGGSSKQVTYILAADITAAKASLTKTSEEELKTKLNDSLEEGDSLIEGASKFEVVSFTPSSAVNAEVSEFKLNMKSKSTALVFKQDDLKKLAEGVLAQEIGSTKEIVEANSLVSEAKLSKLDLKAGTVEATLSGEAYIATKIDQEDVKNNINGDREVAAREYLNGLEGVDEAEIRFFPSFYNRIPRINSHIYFKIEINKNQSE